MLDRANTLDAMQEHETERLWLARVRWRRRGAWQWPLFGSAIVAEAVLLHELPIAGDGIGLVPALLLAGFLNLIAVAVLAPLGGRALRRRDGSLPRVVADDRAGSAAIVLVAAALLAAGLAHRPAVQAAKADFRAQAAAVRRYVSERGPPEYRRNLERLNTWKQATDLYRTCVPGPDPRKALCLIVQTDSDPPLVTLDSDQRPNAVVAGPDNPGRQAP